MKPRWSLRYLLAGVAALAGAFFLLFPLIENLLYDREAASLEREFLGSASGDAGRYDDLYEFLKAENERFHRSGQAGLVDAFSYQTAGVDLSAYGITDNRIGFIDIPSIQMKLPIYLGANKENMRKGAVHLTQTSYPIGGANTNSVIAAHRGGRLVMFRNIDKIKIGDEIIVTNFREKLVYRAAEIQIITPTDIDRVKIQPGRDMLTLISCNPLGKNYQRYVLYCERVSVA